MSQLPHSICYSEFKWRNSKQARPMPRLSCVRGRKMGDQIPEFANYKQRGEWVEMMFMARAAAEGLQVSKPYGDSAAYDFIVEHGALCRRIQVKSTIHQQNGGFTCELRGSKRTPYTPHSFDFAAVFLLPINVWFIFPQMINQICFFFKPGKANSKYHEYEEAWHLLRSNEVAKTS